MIQNDDKHRNVSTKVDPEAKAQLARILEGMGMNEYEFLQLMVEVIIRMSDDRHNLSDRMAKLIQVFKMVPGFKGASTMVDPTGEYEIKSAVYFVNQKGKKGYVPVLVERGWMDGIWNETRNVKKIMEYVVEKCAPDSYLRLREHMQELECDSVFECLLEMVDAATMVNIEDEVADMFRDNQRGDFGQHLGYGNRTKSLHHRTPDGEAARQQRINFDEEDRRAADIEAGRDLGDDVVDGLGCKPFDVEP